MASETDVFSQFFFFCSLSYKKLFSLESTIIADVVIKTVALNHLASCDLWHTQSYLHRKKRHLEDFIFVGLKRVELELQVPQIPQCNCLKSAKQIHII